MSLYLAIGHIVGACIVLFLFESGILWLAAYQMKKNEKLALLEISSSLGIDIAELYKEELSPGLAPKITAFFLDRFSNDLFRNRISDLCGSILTIWQVLGFLINIALFIYVVWLTFTENISYARYAWLIIPISVFFWIISFVFSILCWLITGRYPGQAKQVRKLVENQ
ncbi:hypothetical protein [Legionella sp. PC997]|uniref:hypothetical protein n=1 Tax=Legionella sp. PC997 TaxID=2755562 RepID=UPI0015FBD0BE|nr:hypothetical protein [Legionella sp. PC997]QMT59705.1 hypothetical protein HBNCFIEN_01072 [Legionella sp. PC997]